jgi:hypothetical protein
MSALALQREDLAPRDIPRVVSEPAQPAAVRRVAAAPDALNPYKAAQSYGPLDGDLFFGRDAEGAALARFLIGKPISVLSAPSGIGKTSLLQAKVLPLLEQEHWHTVLARPRDDAIESLLGAFAEHLLPDPVIEAGVLEQIAMEIGSACPLHDALDWFRALPDHERIRRRLYVPQGHADAAALPMVCRALRGSLDLLDLIEHFEAMMCYGTPLDLTPHTTLADFAAGLKQPGAVHCWKEWRSRFGEVHALDDLATLFEQEWAPLRPGLTGAMMVLDQFEEVFTLKKPGTIEALFERLGGFLERSTGAGAAKPMHLMFSLRKEFYADLVPHVRRFGSDEHLTSALGALPLAEARHALAKPAAMIGLRFAAASGGEPACVDGILGMALDEGTAERKQNEPLPDGPRYSPAFISLIGAHLRERLTENPDTPLPLSWSEFQRLIPQLDNVFDSFLESALAKLEKGRLADQVTPLDALELLEKLVTASGFRNIVAEDALIDQLPMKAAVSEALLNLLDFDLKLVRREGRRRAVFVEIMHERLIAPVRRLLAEATRLDPVRASLVRAYEQLYSVPDDTDPTKDLLSAQFREALVRYLDRIDLDGLATRTLLRSVLSAGPGTDERGGTKRADKDSWKNTIRSLICTLDQGTPAERAAMPSGADLNKMIQSLDDQSVGRSQTLYLAQCAMSDHSELAGDSVRRIFRRLATQETSP